MTKVITLRRNKRGGMIADKKKKINMNSIKTNEKYRIFLLLISFFSILSGSLIYRFFSNESLVANIDKGLLAFSSTTWIDAFLYFFEFDIIFLLLSFFIGTSYLGSFLTPVPLALKCLFIGYQSGYLYNFYELKGVLFCLVLLFPCYIITTASLIFAADESIYMSKYLYGTIRNKNTANDVSIRLYLLRYLILLIINMVCIAVNALLVEFIAPKISLA